MTTAPTADDLTPSQRITAHIASLADWRGDLVARLRALVHEADPDIAEEWKWDTPVFAHGGNVCAVGVFKDHVKLNVFKGASLADPRGLFNAGLEAKASRSVDFAAGDPVDAEALKELIRAAVAANRGAAKKK